MNSRYDIATALDVFEHIEQDYLAAANIGKSLKKGGIIIATVPAYQFLWSKHDENCMHKRRYTCKSMEKLIQSAGCKIEYISYYNFFLFPLVWLIRKISKIMKINQNSEIENNNILFLNYILYKIFSSEKILIRKGIKFPWGVSIICVGRKE